MLYIFDNFSSGSKGKAKAHGNWVEDAAREVLGAKKTIERGDLGTDSSTVKTLVDGLAPALTNKAVKVINLSFGFGIARSLGEGVYYNTPYEDGKAYMGFYKLAKDMFTQGKTFVVSAGNESFGDHTSNPMFGVSSFTTTGFALTAAAGKYVGKGRGELSDYSMVHPGFIDYVVKGEVVINGESVKGTSFSAPRLSATIEALQEKYNGKLTQAQVRTILEETCDYGLYNKGKINEYWDSTEGDMSYKFLNTQKALAYNFKPGVVTDRMKVSALYEIYLDRNPDEAGLAYWMKQYRDGNKDAIIKAFKVSPEFKENATAEFHYDKVPVAQQIQAMYHLFLNREADDQGMAFWTDLVVKRTAEVAPKSWVEYGAHNGKQDEFDVALVGFLDAARANGEKVNTDYYLV